MEGQEEQVKDLNSNLDVDYDCDYDWVDSCHFPIEHGGKSRLAAIGVLDQAETVDA